MLSDIEQRFKLHVYEGCICTGASDQEVSQAIQVHVVDPVRLQYQPQRLSSIDVLRAIYFLTQQCHIKWDCK